MKHFDQLAEGKADKFFGGLNMLRRDFLMKSSAAGVAGLSATTLAAPALSQGRLQLRMTTSWPKGFPGLGTGAQHIADLIEKMTDGRIRVELFGAGEIAPGLQAFDATASGAADLYHSAEYYYLGKDPALAFFAAVPYGLTAQEQDAWINHMGGQQLWDELSLDLGIKPFVGGNSGAQCGGWFNREINNVADLEGLNIRMPGLGGQVLNRLGANALALAGGEIAGALQSGTIDATEWVGPWNDEAFGLNTLARYYYTAGFHEPGTSLSFGVNKSIWDSLSAGDQQILAAASGAGNAYIYGEFLAKNGGALKRIVSGGAETREFPTDVWAAFGRASADVMEENRSKSPMFAKVHDSFVAARKTISDWIAVSEGQYLAARNANI